MSQNSGVHIENVDAFGEVHTLWFHWGHMGIVLWIRYSDHPISVPMGQIARWHWGREIWTHTCQPRQCRLQGSHVGACYSCGTGLVLCWSRESKEACFYIWETGDPRSRRHKGFGGAQSVVRNATIHRPTKQDQACRRTGGKIKCHSIPMHWYERQSCNNLIIHLCLDICNNIKTMWQINVLIIFICIFYFVGPCFWRICE